MRVFDLVAGGALAVGMVGLALAVATSVRPEPSAPSPTTGERQIFTGNWSAVGQRQTLPDEIAPPAVIHLSGTVQLTHGSDWNRGFQAEAIGFDDGINASAGRAVWTDARGERVYSTLKGESLQTGRLIRGIITGGTGRYAGLTGEYELRWQYIVEGEDDAVQGRSTDLTGFFQWAGAPP